MTKFVCPYCMEVHEEKDLTRHLKYYHEVDNAPSTIEEFKLRYAPLGLDRVIEEEDEDE